MTEHGDHEISSIFPIMPDDELSQLADDIRQNGLQQPISRFEGKILDGRNRLAACRMAGVSPKFIDFKGNAEEAIRYSWSMNRPRRHLNSSQAAIAEVKRKQLDKAYATTVAKMRKDAPKGGRGKKLRQSIAAVSPDDRKTTTKRALTRGTMPRGLGMDKKFVEYV